MNLRELAMSLAADDKDGTIVPLERKTEPVAEHSPAKTALPKWLRRFISEPNRQPTLLGHVALSTSLVGVIVVSYAVMFWFAGTKQAEWLGTTPTLKDNEINETLSGLKLTTPQKVRLMDQYNQIQSRIEKHAAIMGFFYRQYYISLSMICGGSMIASICLFFISKCGWDRVNNALINIFIVSSGTIIFYGNISLAFKQEDNIRDNQTMYLSYFSLRNEMLSYWATQQANTGEEIPPTKFIHYMDGKLQELSQIRLGFDATRITTLGEQIKQLNSSEPTPTTSPSKK